MNIGILFQLGMIVIALFWFLIIDMAFRYQRKSYLYVAVILTLVYVMIAMAVMRLA